MVNRSILPFLCVLLAGCLDLGLPVYRYGSIIVRVKDQAGEPVPGALVVLYSPERELASSTSRESGRVVFRDVPFGQFGVAAVPPRGYVPAPGQRPFVDGIKVGEAQTDSIEIRLAKQACCGVVRVRVVTTDSTPVAGARLILYTPRYPFANELTGADGRYVFTNVPAEEYGVRVELPTGYAVPPGGRDYLDAIRVTENSDTSVQIVLQRASAGR